MQIRQGLSDGLILLDLDAREIRTAIDRVVEELIEQGKLSAALRERVHKALMSRELEGSTAIGHGAAVPHAFVDSLTKPMIVFVRLSRPIEMAAPDGSRVRYLFLLLCPPSQASEHLETLMTIARLMSDATARAELREAREPKHVLEAYGRYQRRMAPRPEAGAAARRADSVADADRPFGGIAIDLRNRLVHYRDDLRDGLHPKCVAATLFMFFACLAPAVAFGGLMAVMTGNQIGVVEMLVATAACGVVYAMASGAPLTILAGTGPLLIFTALLYDLCATLEIPFLPTYAWTGLWTGLILVVLAAANACRLSRLLTRFSNEIFAALIALIFIVEAVKDIARAFIEAERGPGGHDTALLALLLALGTYTVATSLGRFRRTPYLRLQVREFLSDFGPALALGSMSVIGLLLSEDVYLRTLPVPETFGTTVDRPWLVDLRGVPAWVPAASAVPAALAAVLVFLNQNITTRLIDKPEHRLKRGIGYHLNLAIVGLLIAACSPFGLPWLMASVIPSLNHLGSLATSEEVTDRGGRARERVIHVRENRVTPLAIHLLIGLSLLALGLFELIPMAVLFGLFLYMGVASLSSNQFWERIKLWLMDPALYPPTHYIRKVPVGVIHRYTLIQLACLAVLWAVQASPLGIVFPLLIALLVPLRLLVLGRWLPSRYFPALDAAKEEPDEDAEEAPVIEQAAAVGPALPPSASPPPPRGETPKIVGVSRRE